MEDLSNKKQYYSLYELNSLIKAAVTRTFPEACWVIAEVAELKCNQKGHCYLELVEKEDTRTIAQTRATVWSYEYRNLSLKFEKATGEPLRAGMKVLFLAGIVFHEIYGLSLNVRDIDPSFTMGEMARKKKEVIDRLRKEGLIDLNKALHLPLVPQKIAVISSPGAAGYGDFFNQLDTNPYGYKFKHMLFPAVMQGEGAEDSIISSLNAIKGEGHMFDVVVIIRGGGSAVDLNCFDSYPLAAEAARFSLPIVTGIGHEKDDTVMDIVAHTKMKTPTAVAEFLVSGMRRFEEEVLDIRQRVLKYTERFLKDELYRLNSVIQKVNFIPLYIDNVHGSRIDVLIGDLRSKAGQLFLREDSRFNAMEQALRHLDPENVLKRGYSITRYRGKVVREAALLRKWAVLETTLHKGFVSSIVQNNILKNKKEVKENGEKQADNLLPGFD